jgi:GR25 family glycosyltransferase involved in LPS biosynthesis
MHYDDIPIVVISLDRRPDRWAIFTEKAHAAGIYHKAQRLSAVDAKEFVAHEHPAITLRTAHNIKTHARRAHHEIDQGGAIGCSLSHFKAWEFLKNSSAPALIIFEDDSHVPVDFKKRIETVVEELPDQWDMVTFYNTPFEGGLTGCEPIPSMQPWSSCTSLMGSHAYMISRRGAQRLLTRAYPIEMHVDAYLAFMARMDHIVMLWNPVMQIPPDARDSDIDHGAQSILNVPTNMEKHGIVAMETTSIVGMMAMAAVVGGLVALAYVVKRK